MPRSGNEPANARSPLGLRLALACFGLAFGLAGAVAAGLAGLTFWSVAFGVLAVVAAGDAYVVRRHIRAGAHFQPGPDVPAYEPVDPARGDAGGRRPARARVPAEVRRRRYLILMATCLGLLVLAWVVVLPFSTGLAVALTLVAMVIPPIAAVVANAGAFPRGDDR